MAKVKRPTETNSRYMNMEDVFTFGKYKSEGAQVEDVIEDDPEYIRWLIEEGAVEFEDRVLEALEKREGKRR